MSTMSAERFGQICDEVWRDRAAVLSRCSISSGEQALVRAVYWRISKAGGKPEQSLNDYAPLLEELLQHYRDEAVPAVQASNR